MTAITTAARLLRVAADELKNSHTLGGDWGNEHEALDAYNEHMATATTLEHMGRQCLAQIEEPAGAAPAAVAGPSAGIEVMCERLKAIAASDSKTAMRNALMNAARYIAGSAQAAPALEAPAAPSRTSVAVLQCDCCGHIGINDAADGKAACNTCRWTGDSPAEDKCPGCNRVGTMTTACPECGARTTLIAETHLQAPAALEAPAAPAAPMPWTNARQPHDPKIQDGYMESDLAWCRRNRDAVTWLIDNQAEIRAALAGVPQAPAAPILGDAERLAAARQDKSLADYWRNRVAGLAEEFTTAEAALYLADRIVADLYDLPQAGVARPAAPAAPVLGRSVAEALKDLQEMWDDMAKSSSGPSHERTMRRFGDALSTIERTVAAPAAPAVDAEMSEDAERFRAMANAALTDDEVFGRALDQHPDMGGDATIDDVRAMFDAARAAQVKEGGE